MSYCVHCGVELDPTAEFCPLCHTPVQNPVQPVDRESPKPFPTERQEVPLAAKWELAVLISAMLASAAVCCGILNIFLRAGLWSLYIIGAAVMLWIFLVPPLLYRGLSPVIQLLADVLAVSAYVGAIAWNVGGLSGWYVHIALPIILWLGAELLAVMLPLRRGRSILSTTTILIGAIGVFPLGVEAGMRPIFPGRVAAHLVSGGADHRRGIDDSADYRAPGAVPAGRSAQKISYVT